MLPPKLINIIALFLFFTSPLFISPSSSSSLTVLSAIAKDHQTLLYTLSLYLKNPPQRTNLLLDLGASFTWIDCSNSSTSPAIFCNSPLCSALGSRACAKCFHSPNPDDCSTNPCILSPINSVTHKSSTGKAILEPIALPVTDGRNPGQLRGFPEFLLSCSKKSLLKGLTKGAVGSAGLGRSRFSLTTQVIIATSLQPSNKFSFAKI